jgi:hypothetical protein
MPEVKHLDKGLISRQSEMGWTVLGSRLIKNGQMCNKLDVKLLALIFTAYEPKDPFFKNGNWSWMA